MAELAGRRRVPRGEPEAKRCAIYTRKSVEKGLEQEFNSLDAQRDACEAYIRSQAHLGWDLVPERYDDGGFTGANLERPAFQRLIADVEAGRVNVVVVYKVDRLSRSLLDFAQLMHRIEQAGAALVSVTQNFSTADAMGRLTLHMLMSFAEFEREMIAERTRDKVRAARRKGRWTGGHVPLGYRVRDKKLVVVPTEAALVREVFALYLERRSALEVAKRLNDARKVPKARRHAGRAWNKDLVLRLLRCPVVAGYIAADDALHEGEHEAIIDAGTFARVQALLDTHGAGKSGRAPNPAYLLRGLLRCGRCGQALTPASTRSRGRVYRYYRCITRDKRGRGSKGCGARPLPAEAIEAFVLERVREVAVDEELARDVTERVVTRLAARREALADERRRLPGIIRSLSAEAKKLLGRMDNAPDALRPVVQEHMEDVGRQLAAAQARRGELEGALAALEDAEVEATWVTDMLTHFDAVWDAMTLVNRGRLVRAVVREVAVNEQTGIATVALHAFGGAATAEAGIQRVTA